MRERGRGRRVAHCTAHHVRLLLAFSGGVEAGAVFAVAAITVLLAAASTSSASVARSAGSQDMAIVFSVFLGGGQGTPEHEAIFVTDAHGRVARQLTPRKGGAQHPAWSPDGTKIAFDDSDGTYLMNSDGSHRHRIASSGSEPRWSPDGTRIVHLAASAGKLVIVDADGRHERPLAAPVAWVYPGFDWSPDGRQIALVANRVQPGHTKIYIVNVDGTGLKQFTRTPSGSDDSMPRWSPNGKTLLFTRHHDRTEALYVMKVGGGPPKRLTTVTADTAASWSPDGRQVIYGTVDFHLLDIATLTRTALVPKPCQHFGCFDADWRRK